MRNSMVFDVLTRFVHCKGLTIDSFKDKSFTKKSCRHQGIYLYVLIKNLYPSQERDWVEHWIRLCKLMLKFNTYRLFDKNPLDREFNEKHRINLIKEAISMETRVKDITLPLEYVFLLLNVEYQNYAAIHILYELERTLNGVNIGISTIVCKYLEEYMNNLDKPEIKEKIINLYNRFNLNMY